MALKWKVCMLCYWKSGAKKEDSETEITCKEVTRDCYGIWEEEAEGLSRGEVELQCS